MSNLSRRNFITGGAIAALGGTLAIAGCAPKGESSSTVAGAAGEGAQAWTGTANGKGEIGRASCRERVCLYV